MFPDTHCKVPLVQEKVVLRMTSHADAAQDNGQDFAHASDVLYEEAS
jgi:hypothetical protein